MQGINTQAGKLFCPHCSKALKLPGKPRANQEITCRQCEEIFFGWEARKSLPNGGEATQARAEPAAQEALPAGSGGLAVLGWIGMGLLLLGGVGLGLHFLGRIGGDDRLDAGSASESAPVVLVELAGKHSAETETVAAAARKTPPPPTIPLTPAAAKPAPPPPTIALRDASATPGTREAPGPGSVPKAVPAVAPVVAAVPAMPAAREVPGVTQEAIDHAIFRGAEWLKRQQNPTGSWVLGGKYPVGYAALPGLTLLECKVPPADPHVQLAAARVRAQAGRLDQTYELATTILFLDRLGDPRDRIIIQACALRLVAGQTGTYGWNYRCPLLDAPQMQLLLTHLDSTRPQTALPTTVPGSKEPLLTAIPKTDQPHRKPGEGFPTTLPDQVPGGKPLEPGQFLPGRDPDNGGSTAPGFTSPMNPDRTIARVEDAVPKSAPPGGGSKDVATEKAGDSPKIVPKGAKGGASVKKIVPLPPVLRMIPAVGGRGLVLGKGPKHGDDNSNSQFAMLALWAARRHGVATDRALQLAHYRYRATQNADAGWGYRLGQGSTASMTGVGLLGLGMGLGTAEKLPGRSETMPGGQVRVRLDDPAMKAGLDRFAAWVGDPNFEGRVGDLENLYFLWTVERVAMLYDLRTIGGKDWYRWGAQNLLKHQAADGNWFGSRYPGNTPTVDTCLALLFLKRSNLVDDLSHSLQMYTVIPGK